MTSGDPQPGVRADLFGAARVQRPWRRRLLRLITLGLAGRSRPQPPPRVPNPIQSAPAATRTVELTIQSPLIVPEPAAELPADEPLSPAATPERGHSKPPIPLTDEEEVSFEELVRRMRETEKSLGSRRPGEPVT